MGIVAVLLDNYEYINRLRVKAELRSMNDYQDSGYLLIDKAS